MATVHVNGSAVEIDGDKLKRMNLIQAAGEAGVFIPHYCWHPALSVVASCRMCLVEVGDMKDGKPAMLPKVVPACQTPARDGSVIVTNSAKAKRAQADTLEGLLLNHPLDCPVCDKAGECKLQDFSYQYGRAESRMVDLKHTPPNKPHISSKITLFTDRCIMCSRCVRFTREVAGTAELTIVNRGDHSEIDIFPGEPLENKLSGNVVDLCPVGALGSKDFLYKQRVWFLKDHDSVCAGCATGCSIHADTNKDVIFRLRPRENLQNQGYFMCDEGRWGYHYVNSKARLMRPSVRQADGSLAPRVWSEVLPALKSKFAEASKAGPIAAVVSPFLTCEEAYLLATWVRGLSADAVVALGPIPVVGQDDTFPKDRRGNPIEPVRFTIRAEKCPNRRGVEAVLKKVAGKFLTFDELLGQVDTLQGIWLSAGYPQGGGYAIDGPWLTEDQADRLAKVPLIAVQDLFATPISAKAQFVLPSSAWSEKTGTFVNAIGLAQPLTKANRSAGEVRGEGQIYCDLLGRQGLFRAADVLPELATVFPALSDGLPRDGVLVL